MGRFGLWEGLAWSSPEVWCEGRSCEEFSRGLVCGRVWCGVLQRFGLWEGLARLLMKLPFLAQTLERAGRAP